MLLEHLVLAGIAIWFAMLAVQNVHWAKKAPRQLTKKQLFSWAKQFTVLAALLLVFVIVRR